MNKTTKTYFSYKRFQQANKSSKIYIKLLLIILFSVNNLYSQKKTFYFKDSVVSSEGVLSNGKPDGYWKTYYEDASLKSEGNRLNFLLDSTWTFYFNNGLINKIINYKKNKKQGYFFLYSKEGLLIEKTKYENNYKSGESKIYYPLKNKDACFLKEKNNYSNNILDGFCFEFDSLKKIITIKEFNKGILLSKEQINRFDKDLKKHGKWKKFHANGKVKWEGIYKHGKLNGKIKEYNLNGGIKNIELFDDGQLLKEKEPIFFKLNKQINNDGSIVEGMIINNKKEGTFRVYDKKGELSICNNYKNNIKLSSGLVDSLNLKIDDWVYFYENGTVKAKGNYIKDFKDGMWIYYFLNSKEQQKGKYSLGKPEGKWLW